MQQGDVIGFLELIRDEIRHPARLMGMSLFWSWLQLVFALPNATPAPLFNVPLQPYHQIWTLGLFVTVIAFVIVLTTDVSRYIRQRSVLALSCASMTIGTVLLALSGHGIAATPFSAAGAIAVGLGSAEMFLAWGVHLGHIAPRRVLADTALFSVFTATIYGLCSLIPSEADIAAALMPIFSGILLVRASRECIGYATSSTQKQPAPCAAPPRTANLLGLAVLVGTVFGIMRGAGLSFGGASVASTTEATVLGIAAAGLLLAITAVFFRKESELYLVCEVSFPLLIAGYLLLPSIAEGPLPLPLLIFTAGHTYFYFMLWVFCVGQCRQRGLASDKVFACALLAFLGSTLTGSLFSDVLALACYEESSLLGALSLVVAYSFVLVLVYLLSRTQRTNRRTLREMDRQRAEQFKSCALRIADEASLTPRETEVFVLLAEGFDRAAIRERLVISNDTVKTHIRRLYAKLDIHSKQDVARLVEERLERDTRGM